MRIIFTTTDPTGRNIRLTKEQWSHITEHAEMSGAMERIRETVERPDTVLDSPNDEKVHYLFRHYKDVKCFLMVAVKYINGDGFIITAFYTTQLRI